MRFLKLGVISVIVFFIIFTLIGILFPSTIVVERSIKLSSNIDSVGKYISNYSKWNEWMAGAKQSEIKVMSEDSSKAFYGTTVINLILYKDNTWQHEWKGKSNAQTSTLQLVAIDKMQTALKWRFEQHVKWYPWQKLAGLMSEKILGTSMEQSLDTLKKITEKTN
jgi:hypothetical protein